MKSICKVACIYSKIMAIVIGLLPGFDTKAQITDSAILLKPWQAAWIAVPGASATGYGVYYFRKRFELSSVPQNFPVHVSADNRYKLFINEKLVSLGPERGDVMHWNFETVDLAPFLHTGQNIIAAQVWNEGEWRPEANSTLKTGFILQGGTAEAQTLNTNNSWKCIRDSSYAPINIKLAAYYVAGPGEQIDMQQHILDWETLLYVDTNWQAAKSIGPGIPKNSIGFTQPSGWLLVPSMLPQMELKQQRLATLRKAEGVNVSSSFPAMASAVTIPANTSATLLLDQSFLTNAYPTLLFSGGQNSSITIGYQEALFTRYPEKGNRNETEGKSFIGRTDSLTSDGRAHQQFTTLFWRTFRYLQIRILTKETPLVLEDVYSTSTGYPFVLNAKLETNDTALQQMLEIGWRTARLCAAETYMDCPYYEQLQYIGDTRIQALVSLYNSGDDRLIRNALNQIQYSQNAEGLTQSRYPTSNPQYIPPFSLWYIGMLHDYMMYGRDTGFIKNKLASARQVLTFFKTFQGKDGSLKNLPWWNFTDWVGVYDWSLGIRSGGKDGSSALLDFQLLWAYQLAADMEQKLGTKEYAAIYRQEAVRLAKTIQSKYWDNTKQLFTDRSEKDLFSQHANALAILTGVVSGKAATLIGKRLLLDSTLAPASVYFKYYLHQALTKAGFGDAYQNWLGKWQENIRMGLTTWAETSDVNRSRSDCHAWGASPNIEFFRTLLGIDSDAPGFTKVKVEPHLGSIRTIGGEMPHPKGEIRVRYKQSNGHFYAEINLPSATTGQFIWKGKSYALKEGKNSFVI